MRFTYTLTGWEGSATDAQVYDDAITSDLHIPKGKYLLADAGYLLRRNFLFHIVECNITLQSGVGQMSGTCLMIPQWSHS